MEKATSFRGEGEGGWGCLFKGLPKAGGKRLSERGGSLYAVLRTFSVELQKED